MKRYFSILNLLLITAALYLGVNLSYRFIQASLDPTQESEISVREEVSTERKSHHTLSYYDIITQRNLFGVQTKAKMNANSVDVETLKQTDLNLKLWGTVTGSEDMDYAVIEEPNKKKQQLYRSGDRIQKAGVKRILKEKVVLRIDGKDEILKMEKMQSAQKQMSPKKIRSPSDQNIAVARSQIDDAVQNINDLMRQVKIRPHFLNGNPDGLFVTNIQPGSIFSRLGLKNGDIITGVNGKNIQSVDDALRLYQNLKSSSNVAVQIKRRGETQTIEYQIE